MALTPGGALNEVERRLARLRSFATMDEAWGAFTEYGAVSAETEAHIHQGFDAGYAAAMKLAAMALNEVQTIQLREDRK